MDNIYTILGSNIRTARIQAGLSQTELAKLLGKESSTYISLIESGERKIDLESLVKLTGIFLISVQSFLDNEPIEIPANIRAVKPLAL